MKDFIAWKQEWVYAEFIAWFLAVALSYRQSRRTTLDG
jgi:hypothetical protein